MTPSELRHLEAEHGECLTISDVRRREFVFRSGARCSTTDGRFWPPPVDRVALLHARRLFLARKLEIEIAEWREFRNEVSRQSSLGLKYTNIIPPPPTALDDLRRGQLRIDTLRHEIGEIDAELSASQDASEDRERRAAESQRQEQVSTYLSELHSISID